MFAVLYRWPLQSYAPFPHRLRRFRADAQLKPSTEETFRDAWNAMTETIAGKLPSTTPEASARMRACIAHSLPSTPLEVLEDLLGGLP